MVFCQWWLLGIIFYESLRNSALWLSTLQHRHALSVYPHFVGQLLFIYSCYCSFSLNICNSQTDYFPNTWLATAWVQTLWCQVRYFCFVLGFLLDWSFLTLLLRHINLFVRKVWKSSKHAHGKAPWKAEKLTWMQCQTPQKDSHTF